MGLGFRIVKKQKGLLCAMEIDGLVAAALKKTGLNSGLKGSGGLSSQYYGRLVELHLFINRSHSCDRMPCDGTWTPKVCRIIAFYRFWDIILPTLGGLGTLLQPMSRSVRYTLNPGSLHCVLHFVGLMSAFQGFRV